MLTNCPIPHHPQILFSFSTFWLSAFYLSSQIRAEKEGDRTVFDRENVFKLGENPFN
jgi:hypothetical protein